MCIQIYEVVAKDSDYQDEQKGKRNRKIGDCRYISSTDISLKNWDGSPIVLHFYLDCDGILSVSAKNIDDQKALGHQQLSIAHQHQAEDYIPQFFEHLSL